ncbi:MAG TPA: hypothetical protein VNL18_02175 [Gemmatimonadales bacterium]|nr:hypothetical protein [Gemmatimonadales bacterium]
MLLNTMLQWATTVREPNSERRVKENLLAGLRRPQESKPKRPIATWERFLKPRAAMQALAREATMAHRTGALAQDGVVVEARAALPKLAGGLWHPYRRKWATERKHFPLKDVAAAGGWRDVETLLECYQEPLSLAHLAHNWHTGSHWPPPAHRTGHGLQWRQNDRTVPNSLPVTWEA